jgi:adenylate kinase
MERTRDFRESILESDVIIYDLATNEFEEVDYVIKTLKTSKLTKEKTLVILSSVMTWVNTPPKIKVEGAEEEPAEEGGEGGEEEGEPSEPDSDDVPKEGEEPPEDGEEGAAAKVQIQYFKESDAHLRVPHKRFINDKNLETLALSAPKTQPLLKVHVLCGGIRYGRGEGIFYDHFKNAWIQSPAQLPIIGDGKNLIPTIHINDLARVVKKVIDHKMTKDYIFAVDKTKRPSQKRLVKSISNGIGTG